MGDTDLVPDDGITAGSRTTPSTIPVVRKATATARRLLAELAAKQWGVDAASVEVRDGTIADRDGRRKLSYAELAKAPDLAQALASSIPDNVELTPREAWKVLGTSLPRPNARDLVTGEHRFPSDIVHPGMLYGVVLRPPSYGATLESIDLSAAKAMAGVVAVREGEFVAFAAPTRHAAAAALEAAAKTASWKVAPHPSSKELFAHLKQHARGGEAPAADAAKSSKTLTASYEVAYIQHVPMEPRAAVAQWNEGKVTVWTGTQNPMGVCGEVASALGLPRQQVRVIVPDSGGGFGGKHTNSAAVEAARLARAAGKPVCVRWSREEEFTWAYFRPAALIQIRGGLDGQGKLVAWDFVNINSGGAAIDSPYDVAKKNCRFVGSDAPLRQSSYRALAATANNFAREAFMDELAAAAGSDPLAFRLAHLSNDRLRAVLEEAAKRFGWAERVAQQSAQPGRGPGMRYGKRLIRGRLRRDRGRPQARADRRRADLRGLRVRGNPEPRQPALASPGLHCHGVGRGLDRSDRVRGRQGPQRQFQDVPGAAVQGRSPVGPPPLGSPRPSLGRRRRDADYRRSPRNRQRSVQRHRRAVVRHADSGRETQGGITALRADRTAVYHRGQGGRQRGGPGVSTRSTSTTRTSQTLVCVGPVRIRTPRGSKKR